MVTFRTRWKRNRQSITSTSETFLVLVTCFRSLLDANILQFDFKQFDIRWCSLYCHRTRVRYYSYILQHPLLAIRRSKHLHGHAKPAPVALCHHVYLHPTSYLLLGFCLVSLHCAVLVQPSSILIRRFHHRLPRVLALDVAWKFTNKGEQLVWVLSAVTYNDHWI